MESDGEHMAGEDGHPTFLGTSPVSPPRRYFRLRVPFPVNPEAPPAPRRGTALPHPGGGQRGSLPFGRGLRGQGLRQTHATRAQHVPVADTCPSSSRRPRERPCFALSPRRARQTGQTWTQATA
uniref:Uncharacterized protein n=1 Tax=Molossus molossus TaxID=27622 RepID=A0A7J8DU03_MOLMO|nr:hypothetical protein HJG59_009201 [Molossus molossus]